MIQVIERFHKILCRAAMHPEAPAKLKELAAAADVSPQACSNIVRTMVALGYLEPAEDRSGYRPGMMLWGLTGGGGIRPRLVRLATPVMENLMAEVNELSVLAADSSGYRVELIKLESQTNIRVVGDPQLTGSLFLYATGIAMLAFYPEERIAEYWERLDGRKSILEAKTLPEMLSCLSEVRRLGYFNSEPVTPAQINYDSCATLGAPVFEKGKVVAAVGVKVPGFRFFERQQTIISALCRAAAEISAALDR